MTSSSRRSTQCRFARNGIDDVRIFLRRCGRSDLDFLCRIIEAVIKEGASTINIPDTVGYNVPEQYAERIRQLRERIPSSEQGGLVGALP